MEEEKKYLENVKNVINYNVNNMQKEILDSKKEIINTKKYLYESSHEIFDTDLTEMMNTEDFNVSLVNQVIDKVSKLKHAYLNPYFGRVDFNDKKIYVGITDISKENERFVYDWRSDIASLYYDEKIGKNTYTIGNKKVQGEVLLRRGYNIKMGNLISYFDSDIALRDEMLQEVLNQKTDESMKNIVTTIQKEQNKIIRHKGNIVVEGTSGSGKTSIAMHKIAYTLYNSPLTNKNILILSPSTNFTNYISTVLPSLNEDNVRMITFKKFVSTLLDEKVESLNEFYDRFQNNPIKTDKLSKNYKDKIDNYLKHYKNNLKFNKSLGLKKIKIDKDYLNSLLTKDLSIYNTLEYACEKICDKLLIDEDKNVPALLTIIKELLDIKLKPLDLYNDFLEYSNLEKIDYFKYEDTWAGLYLYFNIHGYPAYGYIKEVVIDEAQDYNIFEYELLKKIFNGSKFTILGDVNQRINPLFKYTSLKDISELFDAKYIYLNKSYRSSKSIVEYSNKILGLTNIVPIRTYSNDIIIKNIQALDELENIIKTFKKADSKLAIITKTKKEATTLKKFFPKETVLPVNIAKGLEYDSVIVYTDIDNYYKKEEFTLYYIAVTRSLHNLAIINQKYTNFVE